MALCIFSTFNKYSVFGLHSRIYVEGIITFLATIIEHSKRNAFQSVVLNIHNDNQRIQLFNNVNY